MSPLRALLELESIWLEVELGSTSNTYFSTKLSVELSSFSTYITYLSLPRKRKEEGVDDYVSLIERGRSQ